MFLYNLDNGFILIIIFPFEQLEELKVMRVDQLNSGKIDVGKKYQI